MLGYLAPTPFLCPASSVPSRLSACLPACSDADRGGALGSSHMGSWEVLWTKSTYAIPAARAMRPGQLVRWGGRKGGREGPARRVRPELGPGQGVGTRLGACRARVLSCLTKASHTLFPVLYNTHVARPGASPGCTPSNLLTPTSPYIPAPRRTQVSAVIGLNCLTMKKRLLLTLLQAYGPAGAAALTPRSFALPEQLEEWAAWVARQGPRQLWMLKTGQDAGACVRACVRECVSACICGRDHRRIQMLLQPKQQRNLETAAGGDYAVYT